MTIEECIAKIDRLYPNDIEADEKREWIMALELMLRDEVMDTHYLNPEECEKQMKMTKAEISKEGYELLVQAPYDNVYIHWVNSQIAVLNVDNESYNNEAQRYNSALLTYKNYFNRTHTPRAAAKARF